MVVSRLGVGTVTFGTETIVPGFVNRIDQAHADRLVGRAIDAGINFFDTADSYSYGLSEEVLGRALGKRRADVVLCTKSGLRLGPAITNTGLSARQIMLTVEASLKRLGTDWVDLFEPHLPDPATPLEETARALEALVRDGKVRYIGLSNFPVWQAARLVGIQERLGYQTVTAAQMYYSLLGRELENECVPFYREAGIGVQVWSPLASGFLSGKYTRDNPKPEGGRRNAFPIPPIDIEKGYDIIDVLRRIAEAHDATISQVATAWILTKDWVSTVILGAADERQFEENIKAEALVLSDEAVRELDALTVPHKPFPTWYVDLFQWDQRVRDSISA
ncbi:aldo/keto reductase [Sphingomonas sp.]|uniref:aldo/keto reductase n=1 Tax=Sphingomonas sp. TaxID=28214 RepID=UPI003AFFF24C